MDRIAFIIGETFIYWHSIVLTLAAATAVCLFLAFWLGRGGSWTGGVLAAAVSCLLSLVLSRLAHWYFQSAGYDSFRSAMTDYSTGGYALMGVFAGCALSACLTRLLRLHKNLPAMLDCMALAGSAGIAVGRLACLYSNADRGMILEGVTQLPLAYPVVDPITGETVYRLATFSLQAIVCGVIFVLLTLFWMVGRIRRKKLRDGDTALIFLLLYCAAQVVFDSTRYDSLFMRSNGFVGVVQILGAAGLLLGVVVFSVRMVRARGWKYWYLAFWIGIAGALTGAGFMEYYVQRHGDQALFAYSVMSACLALTVVLTLVIRLLALRRQKIQAE